MEITVEMAIERLCGIRRPTDGYPFFPRSFLHTVAQAHIARIYHNVRGQLEIGARAATLDTDSIRDARAHRVEDVGAAVKVERDPFGIRCDFVHTVPEIPQFVIILNEERIRLRAKLRGLGEGIRPHQTHNRH